MLSTLRLGKGSSLGEVLAKSREVRAALSDTLKLQSDKHYLKSQQLPQVPMGRAEPRIVSPRMNKNVAKRAGNDAHVKLTNGGYTRTSYGGFFMH